VVAWASPPVRLPVLFRPAPMRRKCIR
jgi:hypothetical protein